jgi:predicted enzyme related to lactoylglutathione lyase
MVEMDGYENGTPCWVDIGTPDLPAAGAFYSGLFGWDVEYGGPEIGHYSMARLRGRDVAALGPQQVPGVVAWTTYLAVDDLDSTVAKVVPAGGSIVVEPMQVMSFGRMAVITDSGGTHVSLWEAGEHKGAGIVGEPGTLCWSELTTRAVSESVDFYRAVVGLQANPVDMGGFTYYEWKLPSGLVVGGLMPMEGDMWDGIPNHWMVYFAVADTDATAARCTELGGQVPVPPQDIPPGRFAVLNDPQGGHFSVIKLAAPM